MSEKAPYSKAKATPAMQCILQCDKPCTAVDSLDYITDTKWSKIRVKCLQWKGLDRFVEVYELINWNDGLMDCTSTNRSTLPSQTIVPLTCFRVKNFTMTQTLHTCLSQIVIYLSMNALHQKDSTPVLTGILHDSMLCISCIRAPSKKNDRNKKLLLLQTEDAWTKFKRHSMYPDDPDMRGRLDAFISSIPDCHTAFGVEIRYHCKCCQDYVSNFKPLTDESSTFKAGDAGR